ncbi:argininosuccinate lyase [Kangiella sediminilitoris]|uniref:Argininosuccinate lyase n=1 Tax=Kangiella sediminilitoris TaxID=1144748 RepID=A0A1B3BCV8_9GAMM|nr:argininosuccinate lyase [Kangiella sediminilitoris]AOE50605.1 argininosuccinate lyase [Kangiella sediminilitoris]
MSQPLWSKESTKSKSRLSEDIMLFMSGRDVILDQQLLAFDIQASKAHAEGLARIGVLSEQESMIINQSLDQLLKDFEKGQFILDERFEDGHSAIEWYLTDKLGELGKKIHTGRSRNDQVSVATRLFCCESLKQLNQLCLDVSFTCLKLAKQHEKDVLPGYTHLQRAVVSSWGLWFASFAEAFCDNAKAAQQVLELIGSNPLGSAAGYGVNLKLDRDYTTKTLGFNRLQINPMYVQNSRGKVELQVLGCFKNALLDLRRMAWDLSLFSTGEYNFIEIGNDFSTGSSIMPNKHNPDAVELMRAEYAKLVGCYAELESLLSLPSGYQRDLQNTKEPLLKGVSSSLQCLQLVPHLLVGMTINHKQCEQAIEASMFATDKAVELVIEDGMAFRDAYRHIKDNYQELEERQAEISIEQRTSPGSCGNLLLDRIEKRLKELLD